MENNNHDDNLRFDKLYKLLGDEVNNIYIDKNEQKIFASEADIFVDDKKVTEPVKVNIDTKLNNIDDNKNDKEAIIKHDNKAFRNKSIISKSDFDDGLDAVEDKKSIREILSDRRFLLVVFILIFISVCVVVTKAFYFGHKVDEYENYFVKIEKKEEDYAKAYVGKEIDNEVLKKSAANELISCINSKIDTGALPESITAIINEINNYYNQSYNYFSFSYKDIYTGFTVSYNENQNIFTASTIKGPTDIYVYEMASQGKIDLSKELTYTGKYYNTGSGLLKNKAFNTKYSIKTLLEYSTVYSDNAAHNMLMDEFGRENMLKFWKEKGTTAIFTQNNNWGSTNAHDATIYMEELYRFYVQNPEYGTKIMNNFMKAIPKFIVGENNYVVANKSGWSGSAIHDVSIVFADNPYIVVALSNLGDTDYYMSYFNKANDLAYKLHTEYWKYKMSVCNDIKQY